MVIVVEVYRDHQEIPLVIIPTPITVLITVLITILGHLRGLEVGYKYSYKWLISIPKP